MTTGRYRVVAQPVALPGKCFLSGETGGDHGPYIDTGKNVKFYGAVYLSRHTVEEMYRELQISLGKDPNKSAEATELEAAKFEGYDEGFAAGHASANEKIKGILNALGSLISGDSDDFSAIDAIVSLTKAPEGDAGESEGSKSGSDKTPERPVAATRGKGHSGVSGNSDDDGFSL